KSIAALDIALGGLPAKMQVEAEVGTGVSAKTVGEFRKVTTCSENLVITTPQERHPESAVKISKASVRYAPRRNRRARRDKQRCQPRLREPRSLRKLKVAGRNSCLRTIASQSSAAKMASAMFMAGPATATQTMPLRGFRSARKLTGTGLAYPNRNGEPSSSRTPGSKIVPVGSMCFKGLRLTRPSLHAVSSPRKRATKPWAAS